MTYPVQTNELYGDAGGLRLPLQFLGFLERDNVVITTMGNEQRRVPGFDGCVRRRSHYVANSLQ